MVSPPPVSPSLCPSGVVQCVPPCNPAAVPVACVFEQYAGLCALDCVFKPDRDHLDACLLPVLFQSRLLQQQEAKIALLASEMYDLDYSWIIFVISSRADKTCFTV